MRNINWKIILSLSLVLSVNCHAQDKNKEVFSTSDINVIVQAVGQKEDVERIAMSLSKQFKLPVGMLYRNKDYSKVATQSVKERMELRLADSLTAKIYEDISNDGRRHLIFLYGEANDDAYRALKVFNLEKRNLKQRVEFFSINNEGWTQMNKLNQVISKANGYLKVLPKKQKTNS